MVCRSPEDQRMPKTPNVGAKKTDDQPWIAAATKALDRLTDKFAKATQADLGKLGPNATAALAEISKLLEAAARQDGFVKSELVMASYQQLRAAHGRDSASSFDVGDPPPITKGSQGTLPTENVARWANKL